MNVQISSKRELIQYIPLSAILIISFILRVWGNSFGLPQRTHIDEPVYVLAALNISSGHFRIDYPTLSPNIYQIVLAFEFGLFFIIQYLEGVVRSAVAFGNSYVSNPTPFYLFARDASAAFSVLSIIPTYLIGRKLIGFAGGLLAALFLSISFIDVRHSHFAEPYTLISLLGITSIFLSLWYFESTGRTPLLLLGAGLAGGAIALRFSIAPLIVIPFLAAYFKHRQSSVETSHSISLVKSFLLIVSSAVLGFLLAYPGFLITPNSFLQVFQYYEMLSSSSQGFQGLIFNEGSGWSFYIWIFSIGVGIPILVAGLIGLIKIAASPHQRLRWSIVLLFPLIYFLILGFSKMAFIRYSVPLMPFLALVASTGILWIYEALVIRRHRLGTIVLFGLLVVLAYIPIKNDILQNVLFSKEDTRSIAKHWIEANIPEGSKIAVQWFTPALATETDPEAESSHTYQVTTLDPFLFNRETYTIDYFRSKGYQYLVLSSFITELRRVNASEESDRTHFINSLSTDAKLIAEFKPYFGDKEPPFFFEEFYSPVTSLQSRDRPGPIIWIYKIS